jgi:hypothetical protein
LNDGSPPIFTRKEFDVENVWIETKHGVVKKETLEDLHRYIESGIDPGEFLRAVLRNDLIESFRTADIYNASTMRVLVKYVSNEVPTVCYGSSDKVRDWIEYHAKQRQTHSLFP